MTSRIRLSRPHTPAQPLALLCTTALLFAIVACTKRSTAQTLATDLNVNVTVPFRFVAYGDTRFHDPHDIEAANPTVRATLVRAVADASPAFICFTGDIVYKGSDANDWKVYDRESSIWMRRTSRFFRRSATTSFTEMRRSLSVIISGTFQTCRTAGTIRSAPPTRCSS